MAYMNFNPWNPNPRTLSSNPLGTNWRNWLLLVLSLESWSFGLLPLLAIPGIVTREGHALSHTAHTAS